MAWNKTRANFPHVDCMPSSQAKWKRLLVAPLWCVGKPHGDRTTRCENSLYRAYTNAAFRGKSTGEIGVTALVGRRLCEEAKNLNDSELVNLQIDEMTIKPSEKYNRNFGKYFGEVDMGGVVETPQNQLANKALAFAMSGFSTHYRIPVEIFFVKQLTAEEQTKLTLHVIGRIEVCGFSTFRLVTDNLSTNVKMISLLNNGILSPVVPYPVDEIAKSLLVPCIYRPLVLSFDPCNALKNASK